MHRLELEMGRIERINNQGPGLGTTCAICQEEGNIHPIKCRHFFHIDCIANHISTYNAERICPICRGDLSDLVRP